MNTVVFHVLSIQSSMTGPIVSCTAKVHTDRLDDMQLIKAESGEGQQAGPNPRTRGTPMWALNMLIWVSRVIA